MRPEVAFIGMRPIAYKARLCSRTVMDWSRKKSFAVNRLLADGCHEVCRTREQVCVETLGSALLISMSRKKRRKPFWLKPSSSVASSVAENFSLPGRGG